MKLIYEDENLLVVDKPAGMLVHPTEAGESGTLVQWLTDNYPETKKMSWPEPNRAGIVHRLDKDTSGLIILAKNPETLDKLQDQFKKRQVEKTYEALVLRRTDDKGRIETNLVRAPDGRQKVQILDLGNHTLRAAITEYETIKRYHYNGNDLSLLKVHPKTGRLHQIRVHLKYLGFPIIGDQLYCTKESQRLSKALKLERQFLHSSRLSFEHPVTHENLHFEADLPPDLKAILEKLQTVVN